MQFGAMSHLSSRFAGPPAVACAGPPARARVPEEKDEVSRFGEQVWAGWARVR